MEISEVLAGLVANGWDVLEIDEESVGSIGYIDVTAKAKMQGRIVCATVRTSPAVTSLWVSEDLNITLGLQIRGLR